MIDGWFGQVGFDSQTRAAGVARRISSSAWRIAPVPPGVAAAATRSCGTLAPRITPDSAAWNAGSPASPV